jgi:hypothetical protein
MAPPYKRHQTTYSRMYKTLKNRPFPKLELKKGNHTEKPMILINFFKVYNYNTRVMKLIENKTV